MNTQVEPLIANIRSFAELVHGAYSDLQSTDLSITKSINILRGVFTNINEVPSKIERSDTITLRYGDLSADVDNDGDILIFNKDGDIVFDGNDEQQAIQFIIKPK